MKKSKLFDICQSLELHEWKLFLDYLESPAFNNQENLIPLAKYLSALAKNSWPEKKLTRQDIWQRVYPQQVYTYKEMAYLMSKLLRQLEQFVGWQQQKQHPFFNDLFVLEGLAQRKLDKSYTYRLQRTKQEIEQDQRQDSKQVFAQYWLSQIEGEHFSLVNTRAVNPHLSLQDKMMNDYFVLSKLRLYCTMLNQKRVLKADYEFKWSAAVLEDYKSENEVIRVYQCLYRLLTEDQPNEERFIQYQYLLNRTKALIPVTESISLYYFAINYCLQAIYKGQHHYAEQLLEIYQSGLKAGDLLINDELSPPIYSNAIKLGLGLKRFDWVENIIRNYTQKLPAKDRNDAFYFNLADLYYYQQEYNQAQEHLNQIEFSNIFYKHGAKIMLLKIFFEKNETEAFLALAHSYKLLLLREKALAEDLKASYRNFLRFITKLHRTHDKIKLEKIKMEIQQTQRINAKRWLLQQLNNHIKAKRAVN